MQAVLGGCPLNRVDSAKGALHTAIEKLAADAARYRWLKANMTYVELGTYRAPNSELVSPMSRRWYHQTTDMQSNTIDELADKAMKGTT